MRLWRPQADSLIERTLEKHDFSLMNSFFFFHQPNPFRIWFFVLMANFQYICPLVFIPYFLENIKNLVFLKDFSINKSALWRHNPKNKNPYKTRMHYPIRIIFVPLNFILQGFSDKNKKYICDLTCRYHFNPLKKA